MFYNSLYFYKILFIIFIYKTFSTDPVLLLKDKTDMLAEHHTRHQEIAGLP